LKNFQQQDFTDEKLKEECGVVGIYKNDAMLSKYLYYGLYTLQHRGEESAGIAVSDGARTEYHKGMGLVPEVFNDDILAKMKGNVGIGHVRYSTSGESYVENAQPLVVRYRGGSIALAHNGNLVNGEKIRRSLEDDGVVFQTSIDTEVIVNLLARYSSDGTVESVKRTLDLVKGAYALVIMKENELIGVRDPLGLRPLSLGQFADGGYVLASETCAFDVMDAEFVREVEPGEMIRITKEGLESIQYKKLEKRASCIFEYIYFARPDSVLDGVSVYEARLNAGKILAKEHPVKADMVAPVPDSSIPAALGYAQASGIPYGDALMKNKYIGRTFIQPEQSLREIAVKLKLIPFRENIKGKSIVIIDDSIVRGTTSRRIVHSLKKAGAREVHVRISSPPVVGSCYFGIDTPHRRSLIAATQNVEEIRKTIGADSLGFISIDGLTESIGTHRDRFCLACFDQKYPMDVKEQQKANGDGPEKTFNRLQP